MAKSSLSPWHHRIVDLALVAGVVVTWMWTWWPSWAYAAGVSVGILSAAVLVFLWTGRRSADREAALRRRVRELEQSRETDQRAFLKNMGHELRTPMNGVMGMAGLLLDTELKPEQREYARTIRQSGEQLLHVFNQVLDYSSLEAGAYHHEQVELDPRLLVEDVVELNADEAEAKDLELIVDVSSDVPATVLADEGSLRQVLANLMSNAVKYTQQGEVCVRVQASSSQNDKSTLRFEVEDTGPGFEPGADEGAFGPHAGSQPGQGNGLGIAISRKLAHLMGGTLELECDPNRGTLAALEVEATVVEQDTERPSVPDGLQGKTILVVDDNARTRASVLESLYAWGITADECSNAASAMALVAARRSQDRPYTAVLVDAGMTSDLDAPLPGRLASASEGSGTQVIALASSRRQAQQLEHHSGLGAVITKPVRRAPLWDSLTELCGRARPANPSIVPGPLHSQPPRPLHRRARGRILVADDNVVNQRVSRRLLNNLGFRCDVVGNGMEALEALRRAPYDLVLMDCNMPHLDGVEATRRWREQEGPGQHVPILAVTASALPDDEARYVAAGMDTLLPKPLTPQALSRALEAHMQPSQSEPEQLTHRAANLPAVDIQTLERLSHAVPSASEMGFVMHMIELFVQFGPRHAKALRSAIHARQGERAQAAATALARTASAIGALPMAELAERAGEAAVAAEWQDARALAAATRDELERAKSSLTSAQEHLIRRSGVTSLVSSIPPAKKPHEKS